MTTRKLPIGVQDFASIREDGYLYIDKTAHIEKLLSSGKPYFLARPRRFGKSLFLSTLKYYFMGRKDLFQGLTVDKYEKDWIEYPMFYIDLNTSGHYKDVDELKSILNSMIGEFEDQWGADKRKVTIPDRFKSVLKRACKKSGKKVVVLVDEYDKPLISTMDDPPVYEKVRNFLKGFYGVLKAADLHIRFAMLTGVTKFSKVSVFSDLNQLNEIGMDRQYSEICGISEQELLENFQPEIQALAEENGLTYDETLARLKKMYDGYHFAANSVGMYNPWSLLNTFSKKMFVYEWFRTGTPTLLVNMLRKSDFNIPKLDHDIKIDISSITDYREDGNNPIPLLYQSGYLTIKKYDPGLAEYTLGFPNEEVKYGFLKELLPAYTNIPIFDNWAVGRFIDDLRTGNVESFMTRFKSYFSRVPYEFYTATEKFNQLVFYLIFTLMGQFVKVEEHSIIGRSDAVVETDDAVYIFEFKLDENATAEEALKQIDDRGYATPYLSSGKKIVKVGVEFDTEKRTIGRWIIA
jgi:hypothetical protein